MERAKKEWADTSMEFASDAESVFSEADAVLLVTEWPEFRTLPFEKCAALMKNRMILDGRGHLEASRLQSAGIRLITLGRASR
jgi:UDPglucose 6-dehydrogenase